MERDLISKKELLDEKGISYGQLYRWKRKQLIPEEWFIRKSTFTGQETFFPKDLILARIDKIMNMKDDLSLDELAGKLSPLLPDYEMRKIDLMKRNIVSSVVLQRFASGDSDKVVYSFEFLLYFYVVDKLLQAGEMSMEEGEQLLQTMREHFPKFNGKPCDLVFIRKMGVSSFALISVPAEFYFESGVKLIARLSVTECIEQLKGKLV
ncbi:YhbD family protein [Cohnella sp. NL03-T5]|uniref:YhbD family protein n=2 Tax=Cohnella silvisoli TaxID=2873699 RepID=A0ABV1KWN8_9BACL|nr:YhbD family protein [Cohnella silvisoli]MCD9023882.1 YhbD family protein [Cohnella silvisoli]